MKLSPRLLKIAGMVPDNAVVADIGTDHALLPVYLVATGKCPRAIATDVKPSPLEAARKTVRDFAVESQVELRLGDGLSPLRPHEADVLVLAGMGGRGIVAALEHSPQVRRTARRLVLQPMNDAADLRRWLVGSGFRLAREDLVREGERIYEVLAADPGGAAVADGDLPEHDLEVGPRLWEDKHPLLREFLGQQLEHCRNVLRQVEAGGRRANDRAGEAFRRKVARLEKLLAEVESWTN